MCYIVRGSMSCRQIAAQANLFMLAGYETTSVALAQCIYHVTKYPEAQAKLIREVDQFEKQISYDDLDHFPYAAAVLNETLRLVPPAPLFARIAMTDSKVCSQSCINHVLHTCQPCSLPSFFSSFSASARQAYGSRWLFGEDFKLRTNVADACFNMHMSLHARCVVCTCCHVKQLRGHGCHVIQTINICQDLSCVSRRSCFVSRCCRASLHNVVSAK